MTKAFVSSVTFLALFTFAFTQAASVDVISMNGMVSLMLILESLIKNEIKSIVLR